MIFFLEPSKQGKTVSPLIGKTTEMLQVLDKIGRAARADSPVLICGEPGTGKRLAAQVIHQKSSHAAKPFLVVPGGEAYYETQNDRLPCGLKKSATECCVLFDAVRDGTLVLHEITRFPNLCQAKLLKKLEERHKKNSLHDRSSSDFLGDEKPSDFRVMVTTSRPPLESVEQGTLREDLYYPLSIVTIQLPPLRERKSDIPHLVHYFLDELCTVRGRTVPVVGEELMNYWIEHPWPGNIAQLRDCLTKLMSIGDTEVFEMDHLKNVGYHTSWNRRATPAPIFYPSKQIK